MGCGRTDAGVHAAQFFAHINLDKKPNEEWLFIVNKMLPDDIAIHDLIPVEYDAHAQHQATLRTYDYYLHFYKHPILAKFSSLYFPPKLAIEKINQATALLLQYQDYQSFCKQADIYKSTLVEIKSAQLFRNANTSRLRLQITANRFLRGMMRLIVARLLEVGRSEISLAEFESYLCERRPLKFKNPAYPQGLFLSKITYPFLDIPSLKIENENWILVA